MNEKWDWSYITVKNDTKSVTLKVLHYQCLHPNWPKSWYRVYDHGVEGTLHESVINKCVGYGDTLEEALLKLFEVRSARSS